MRHITTRTLAMAVGSVALCLAVPACSDDDGDDEAATTLESTTTSSTSTTEPETESAGSEVGSSEAGSDAGTCESAIDELLGAWEGGGETDAVNAATVDSLQSCSSDEWVVGAQRVDDFLGAGGGYVGDMENLCVFAKDLLDNEGGSPEDLMAC